MPACLRLPTISGGICALTSVLSGQWEFALYFLASLPEGTAYDLDPTSDEAAAYLWGGDYAGHKNVALELTHNYGTEKLEGAVYHGGNAMEDEGLGARG